MLGVERSPSVHITAPTRDIVYTQCLHRAKLPVAAGGEETNHSISIYNEPCTGLRPCSPVRRVNAMALALFPGRCREFPVELLQCKRTPFKICACSCSAAHAAALQCYTHRISYFS
jgi:hypothetical protein